MPSLNSKTGSPRALLKKRQAKVRVRRRQMQFFYLKQRSYIAPAMPWSVIAHENPHLAEAKPGTDSATHSSVEPETGAGTEQDASGF